MRLRSVQMVPLQDLNIGFLEIETACQHARDVAITLDFARSVEEFHDAPVFVVFDGSFRLRDKVGVIFHAHGVELKIEGHAQSVSDRSVDYDRHELSSRPRMSLQYIAACQDIAPPPRPARSTSPPKAQSGCGMNSIGYGRRSARG